jgi:hypothetical protein
MRSLKLFGATIAGAWDASTKISIYGCIRIVENRRITDILTFIGFPSTRIPLRAETALLAPSGLWKIMLAIPRLWPLGPYEISARLTGPTDLAKYS